MTTPATPAAPPAWDGSGSLFAMGLRICLLDSGGAPRVGTTTCYTTDALVKLELGLEYQEAKEVTQTNGAGIVCVNYSAPPTLKRGQISTLQLCSPDPIALEFMIGGATAYDANNNPIGYSAPEVGVENRPNGMGLEIWSRAVLQSAYARNLPYMHWVVPQAYLAPTKTWELGATAALTPDIDGYCIEDPGFGRGPMNDYQGSTDRVWQYLREATMPVLSPAFHPISQTPSAALLHASDVPDVTS